MAYRSSNGMQQGMGLPPLLSRPPSMNAPPLGGMSKRLTSSEHFSASASDDAPMGGGMPPLPVPSPANKPDRPDTNAPAPREGEEQTEKKAPFWTKRPFFKVPNKLKKKRQNARLKKILQPKNATMVLHEIRPGVKYSFHEQYSKLSPHLIISSVEVDGKTYLGKGLSRAYAKMNAAETVLKNMLLQKLYKTNYSTKVSDSDEPKVKSESEAMEAETDTTEATDSDDDFPWGSLASFALYKLFSEWETQPSESVTPGAQPEEIVPEPVTTASPPKETVPKNLTAAPKATAAPMKKVPDNPTERHPVMLLHQLRPGTQFEEVSSSGPPGDVTFTMKVVIDDKTFTGIGKNKKEAKKETAKAALAGAYDIKYD